MQAVGSAMLLVCLAGCGARDVGVGMLVRSGDGTTRSAGGSSHDPTDGANSGAKPPHATCSGAGAGAVAAVNRDPDCGAFPYLCAEPPSGGPHAKVVILFIGDGMAGAQINAARMFGNGNTAPLTLETLPHVATVRTVNTSALDGTGITDSAGAGTALATGTRVDNNVISRALPGDGSDLTTALEVQASRGRRTGLVTAATHISDATPAAFGAHADSRYNYAEIAEAYLTQTRPNVLFGQPQTGITPEAAQAAGYAVATNAEELHALDPDITTHVSGQFALAAAPTLSEQVAVALQILAQEQAGFFLLVEHEGSDTGGHAADLSMVIDSIMELDDAVETALAWATGRDDVLIVVGGDHETGGLVVEELDPIAGELPDHCFTTSAHTARDVPYFAVGVGAERVTGNLDLTDLFALLAGYSAAAFTPGIGDSGVIDTYLSHDQPEQGQGRSNTLVVGAAQPDGGSESQILLRFDHIFEHVPEGSTIVGARLYLNITEPSTNLVPLHHLLVPWSDSDTWSSFGGGVQADEIEAAGLRSAIAVARYPGVAVVDVSDSVLAWAADPSQNFGWAVLAGGADPLGFDSSEGRVPPRLVVHYDP